MPGELPPELQAQVKYLTDLIGKGVMNTFVKNFPTGIADPNTPLQVRRVSITGEAFMQNTTFAQLVAEQVDSNRALTAAMMELSKNTKKAINLHRT